MLLIKLIVKQRNVENRNPPSSPLSLSRRLPPFEALNNTLKDEAFTLNQTLGEVFKNKRLMI